MINIQTKVKDEEKNIIFEGSTRINNPDALFEFSKPRMAIAKDKGEKWTSGAIPFFAGDLINSVRAGEIGKKIDDSALQVAAAVWVYESVFHGVTEREFKSSELLFTMYPSGAVAYDRVPAKE